MQFVNQCRLDKDWNADTADANNADFHGFLLNPFLSAFENPRNQRSIYFIVYLNDFGLHLSYYPIGTSINKISASESALTLNLSTSQIPIPSRDFNAWLKTFISPLKIKA